MRRLLVLAVIVMVACSNEPVKPDVKADVETYAEYDDGFSKIGMVTLRLENASNYPVYTVAVSVTLKTDQRSYHRTVYDDRGIPPETVIWLSLEFSYIDYEETAALEGVSIDDVFID